VESQKPPLAGHIDARAHLASLAGQTILGVLDGLPYRILGVTRDHVYVSLPGSPLGRPFSVAEVQAAFDRLAAAEEVRLTDASLGTDAAFVGAALQSMPGAELLHGPARIALRKP
jgi:hypothetical protein